MFSRFFIRSTIFRRSQSTVSVSRTRPSNLGSATVIIGALAIGWYGGKYHFYSTKAAESLAKRAAFPDIEPERNYPFQFLKPPTPAEVTEILTEKSWSYTKTGVPGVSKCDGAQLPSNGQIEDRFVYGKVPSPFHERGKAGDDWLTVGVFDGHCGSQTSEAVSKSLIPYVHGSLRQLAQPADDASVDQAIKHGFVALDDVFIQSAQQTMDSNASFAEKALRLTPGSNGSCALLALFDPSTRTLRVACTGDSRAVLGYQSPTDGKWEMVELSVDQNVNNEAEMARVHREHPDEEATIVSGSYYMGLQPTRVFGDGRQ
jgi:pyruvate dehydrogenase phosphatase